MAKPKRRTSPKAKQTHPGRPRQTPTAQPERFAEQVSRMSSVQVLERITRVRAAQQQAEAELAVLIDHAVGLGIGWPEIATQLDVSRQAARQHYWRRHRDDASRRDGPA